MNEIKLACKSVLKDLKEQSKVKYENCIDNLESFDRLLRLEEKLRNNLIGRVLIRQRVFPEKAHAILTHELLDGMIVEDLQCIIDSYDVTEEEIALNLK